jgi:hypothetical protein
VASCCSLYLLTVTKTSHGFWRPSIQVKNTRHCRRGNSLPPRCFGTLIACCT